MSHIHLASTTIASALTKFTTSLIILDRFKRGYEMSSYKVDVTIEVAKLRENPVLPEIVQILSVIRSTWKSENIRAKVRLDYQF